MPDVVAGIEPPPWWLQANWPAPAPVCAGITMRSGGHSLPPFAGFNLATHVGDSIDAVTKNRALLRKELRLPAEPCWLTQVHGARVIDATTPAADRHADGSHTTGPGAVCAVLVADCVPVLLANRAGDEVAALHAGWRGIAAGIVAAGVVAMASPPPGVLAWIGPCIEPQHYEVGAEVRHACLARDPGAISCFHPARPGHWHADLPGLVRRQLLGAGVQSVHGGEFRAYRDAVRFFSHRRDSRTGRMAALIWISPDRT